MAQNLQGWILNLRSFIIMIFYVYTFVFLGPLVLSPTSTISTNGNIFFFMFNLNIFICGRKLYQECLEEQTMIWKITGTAVWRNALLRTIRCTKHKQLRIILLLITWTIIIHLKLKPNHYSPIMLRGHQILTAANMLIISLHQTPILDDNNILSEKHHYFWELPFTEKGLCVTDDFDATYTSLWVLEEDI